MHVSFSLLLSPKVYNPEMGEILKGCWQMLVM